MIEKEYKFSLTNEDYLKLKEEVFKKGSCFTNYNYYFSSENDFSCRIRNVDDERFELTFKKRLKGEVSTHLEVNLYLTKEVMLNRLESKEIILNNEELAYLSSKGLEVNKNYFTYLGRLKTLRYEFKDDDFIYSLDKSSYLGVEDLELELEQVDSTSNLEDKVEQFFKTYDVTRVEAKDSKQKRFMNRLEALDFLDYEEQIALFKEAGSILISPGFNEKLEEFKIIDVYDFGQDFVYTLLEQVSTKELIYFKTKRNEDIFMQFSLCNEDDLKLIMKELAKA